ncbi:hypothetical protein KSX_06980 [Ktedonospora formicarum]|uniref:Uncharacterized protein n=1 Tax=Ktedonospora formicarum TaxID=2778364 RepID=A0A8J3MP46_9CHLR|nr:hypothetical protein KSX_06980 [Ktedonospora formicarum]
MLCPTEIVYLLNKNSYTQNPLKVYYLDAWRCDGFYLIIQSETFPVEENQKSLKDLVNVVNADVLYCASQGRSGCACWW